MTDDATTDRGTFPAFVDRDWIQRALDDAGVADGAPAGRGRLRGWIGTGQMARNARIALDWDDPTGRPMSVVAKVASADETVAAFSFQQGGYQTELNFYDQIAATVDCRVPIKYRTECRPDDLEFALLMEDVVDATQGDQFDGLDEDQLDLAIGQAVGLHVPRFGDPSLPDDLDAAPVEEFADFIGAVYPSSVDVMVDRLGDGLDDEVVDVFRAVAPHIGTWAAWAGAPETAVHGDMRADNLLFGHRDTAPPIVVVDWQTVRPGGAANDLTYLVSGSIVDPEDRSARERDLVASYLDRMRAAGVSLDPDEFFRAYRLGSIWGLLITSVATMSATRTERGDALFTVMAQRHGWQAVHLEAVSLLT
ncbi:MAG: phosphotransferase [Acidimicrobiales bacterium]|nr:phosphotransferase [Acidimicrobiales bacterium]